MEALALRIAHFLVLKHYIEPEQAEWFQYGLVRRMMGCLTFLLLLPTGAIFVGWLGSFLYLDTLHFKFSGLAALVGGGLLVQPQRRVAQMGHAGRLLLFFQCAVHGRCPGFPPIQ